MVNESYIAADLYRTRNMRLAFRDGFYLGGLQAALMTLTGGRFPNGKYRMLPTPRPRARLARDRHSPRMVG
ncbi:MAG: hypothetical protein Q8R92_08015 [Deltaproteobacteria bacterium]|nr:hypothetical protein [Deltaproteobacteria bacterium]